MRLCILLDQNIPPLVCDFIRELRPLWKVVHVDQVSLPGATDRVIFDWAQRGGWIVVTFDEDFADARMFAAGPMQA